MIPPTDWTSRRTVRHGSWFLLVFHQRQLGPACGSMSYIRLGFQPGSSRKWRALEKDAPGGWRRNRNAYEACAIWRVVSLKQRGFAAFLQDEFDEQSKPRTGRAGFPDRAGSCGMGREDHDRFGKGQARPVVRRARVLDRRGLHRCGSGRVSGPQQNSSGDGIVGNSLDGSWRIERAARYETVIGLGVGRLTPNRPPSLRSVSHRAGQMPT
jgi:hypothetical protein